MLLSIAGELNFQSHTKDDKDEEEEDEVFSQKMISPSSLFSN